MPQHIKTPLIRSLPLSEMLGKDVYLKLENLQPTGSFKDRGMGNLCDHLAKENHKGLIASSGGNAGIAVSYAGRRLNMNVTIVVPKTTPTMMLQKIKTNGAHLIIHGNTWNEADDLAHEMSQREGLYYVSPFDNPLIWQGYESIVHEMFDDGIKPDAIILAVGGAGLFTGIMQGLKNVDWLDIDIITAETEGAASFYESYQQKKRIKLSDVNTIATTLGSKQITEGAMKWLSNHPISPQKVTDKQAISACLEFASAHRMLVEPACGAALSVLFDKQLALSGYKKPCVIVCGGNGVSIDLLSRWRSQFNLAE